VTSIHQMHERLRSADGIETLLDAAHDAFAGLLSIIRAHEDPADGLFIPLVMAAASAAEGRNAITFARSLPPRRLHPATAADEPGNANITAGLAALIELLAARLSAAARDAPDRSDQAACHTAARCARDIHALLTGTGP
jgi:hypothetical protein